MADSGDRTEPATPRRREEARRKGQVARSNEIGSAFILLVGFAMIWISGSTMYDRLAGYMKWILSPSMISRFNASEENVGALFMDMFLFVARVIAPMIIALLVVGIVLNVAQVGMRVSFSPLAPNFNKLDPLKGIKRLISMRAIQELVKSLLKLAIVGLIAYQHVKGAMPDLIMLHDVGLRAGMVYVSLSTINLVMKICLVLVVLAIFDWIYQKFDFEKSIKMTKQEIKDEHKQREGDPLVRSRIRQKQREIAFKRMMAEVPKADVVITNPIRIAVALSYVAEEMHAPKIVAKGAGVIAERIREVAKENDVPIIEDKPLAQSLFKMTEVGDYVPPTLFKAVAEILAYIYRIGRKKHSFGI